MKKQNEEYKWLVNLVRERNPHLNLSFEQAKNIYEYEETDFEFTTVWKEIDRDKQFMKSILTENQFQIYLKDLTQRIKRQEESINNDEKRTIKEIEFLKQHKQLIQEEYLPPILEISTEFNKCFSISDKNKLSVIQKKYKEAIIVERETTKIELFNHYKNLNPKVYLEWELRVDIDTLIPNPNIFSKRKRFHPVLNDSKNLIKKYHDEINLFLEKSLEIEGNYWSKHETLLINHYELNKEPKGWRFEIIKDEDESNFERKFGFIMLEV